MAREEPLRLQVYLARCGIGSRRGCEKIIEQGRVAVNGESVTRQGVKVEPGDRVEVDGKEAVIEAKRVYLALNKPPGYLCSQKDSQGRPLAVDLIRPKIPYRVFHVGRLDFNSSGLIFYTNDGDFAARITHPSQEIEKEYRVDSPQPIPRRMIEDFRRGITLEGQLYQLKDFRFQGNKRVYLVLAEGKNREIRRVFEAYHQPISRLHRIRIGSVHLRDLESGSFRHLTQNERRNLW